MKSTNELADFFGILADKTRLDLLLLLAKGTSNVSALCDKLKIPQPSVSHHLGMLRMSGLVLHRSSGKQRFYSLNEKGEKAVDVIGNWL